MEKNKNINCIKKKDDDSGVEEEKVPQNASGMKLIDEEKLSSILEK